MSAPFMSLDAKLTSRNATVSVIGLGYVGLPLAVAFAEAGFKVVGIDINAERVGAVNRRESYIGDVPDSALESVMSPAARVFSELSPQSASERKGWLTATSDFEGLADSDIAIVCVPTPLSKTKDPDISHIVAVTREIAQRLHPGMLVILESTTYPGTTEEIILPSLQRSNGRSLEAGRDFFLAFSPERIDPGRKDWTIYNTPKVVGGVTRQCTLLAAKLYGCAIKTVVPVSGPKVAEMVKLLENTFRATNIAMANEMAIMCERLGIDVWEVIETAKTKPFGFMPFYPGPGLGGHCIPIDPRYLAWKLRSLNYNPRLIQVAEEINSAMPEYVLGRIADALNGHRKPLKGSRVLALGAAYKANVGDVRDSPALDIIHLLRTKGADVAYNDPYIPQIDVQGVPMRSVELTEQALSAADCVAILAGHRDYQWDWIAKHSKLIVDTRNAVSNRLAISNGNVVKL